MEGSLEFGWVLHSTSLSDFTNEHKKDSVSGVVMHVSVQVAY